MTKITEEMNELKEEKLEEVVGGQEPPEFEWKESGFQTPSKEEVKKGHIFRPIGPTSLESNEKESEYIHIRPNK